MVPEAVKRARVVSVVVLVVKLVADPSVVHHAVEHEVQSVLQLSMVRGAVKRVAEQSVRQLQERVELSDVDKVLACRTLRFRAVRRWQLWCC